MRRPASFLAIPGAVFLSVLGVNAGQSFLVAAVVVLVVAVLVFVLVLRGVGPIFESEGGTKRFHFGPAIRDRGDQSQGLKGSSDYQDDTSSANET
jgi:uncharacterized membrane-anchored protein